MGAGCEFQIEGIVCHPKVAPMGLPAQPPPFLDRPSPSPDARKSISRNLFGSPAKGVIDAHLAAEQEIAKTYVKQRFNIDLEEIDNLPISALTKSKGAMVFIVPNSGRSLQGVKRKFSKSTTNQQTNHLIFVHLLLFISEATLV